MVYRLIFLLTVEERGLLHPSSSPANEAARRLYAEGYGIRRLRDRSVKRNAHDRFADLWEATKIVFRGVAAGEPRLALPALAGIFAANQCPALDSAKLQNRSLLLAIFRLSWLRDDGGLARVNWRDMGPEELGSVYESLLELDPDPNVEKRAFNLRAGNKGNARKTSGTYYTPDSLVQVLLDNALDPVIADSIAKNPANPVEALLGLSIVDPACVGGSATVSGARCAASGQWNALGGRVPARAAAGGGSLHLRCGPEPNGRRALQGEPVDGGGRTRAGAHVPELAHPTGQRPAGDDARVDGEGDSRRSLGTDRG
jgi:hypothetical protein